MKKLVLITLSVVMVSISCTKEEIKEAVVDRIEATAVMTADIDSVSVSFPGTTFSYLSTTNTITVAGASLDGNSINISCVVDSEGHLVNRTDTEARYGHGINTNDIDYTAVEGSFILTKWDTENDLISGTFNFKYVRDQETVHITNGIFTDLGK